MISINKKKSISHWQKHWVLFLLFLIEISKAIVIVQVPILTKNLFEVVVLITVFYLGQVLIGPVQGKWSDGSCRKKHLCLALLVLAVSVFLIPMANASIYLLGFLLAFAGAFGNADVIGIAMLYDTCTALHFDTKFISKLKKYFSGAFLILPPAWVIVSQAGSSPNATTKLIYYSWIALVLSTIVSFIIINDPRDHDKRIAHKIWPFLLKKCPGWDLFALLCTQISFQLTYLYQDLTKPIYVGRYITTVCAISMMIGVGAQYFLGLKNFMKDSRIILLGMFVSIVALLPATLLFMGVFVPQWLSIFFRYSMISAGCGIYLPRYFIRYCPSFKSHEQGVFVGIILSIMVVGESCASLTLEFMPDLIKAEKLVVLAALVLMLTAFLSFIIACYRRPAR